MSLHACPHPDCNARLSRDLFACSEHLAMLPGRLRRRLESAIRAGDVWNLSAGADEAHRLWRDREVTTQAAAR